jgi:hypothetical protein
MPGVDDTYRCGQCGGSSRDIIGSMHSLTTNGRATMVLDSHNGVYVRVVHNCRFRQPNNTYRSPIPYLHHLHHSQIPLNQYRTASQRFSIPSTHRTHVPLVVAKLFHARVPILAGSDATGLHTPPNLLVPTRISLHQELELVRRWIIFSTCITSGDKPSS